MLVPLRGLFIFMSRKTGKIKQCDWCKKEIYIKKKNFKWKNNFCSMPCKGMFSRGKPSGRFSQKLVNCFFCKKLFYRKLNVIKRNIHHYCSRQCHPKWLGENVGYSAKHTWLRTNYPKPEKCEHCGILDKDYRTKTNQIPKKYPIQWANKSGKYLRDRSDWLLLCFKCHRKYDNK